MSAKKFYGDGLPGVNLNELQGQLIVIEGADGSGRSTQIAMLKDWLERKGYAIVDTGLKRSTLVSEELQAAKQGNVLGHTTMSVFYATDFADQLENKIRSLSEMAINRQEPEFISNEVGHVASSMMETERTMNDLQFATGLAAVTEETPELLRTKATQTGS